MFKKHKTPSNPPDKQYIKLILLAQEYRRKYEPTLLERKLLETFPLSEVPRIAQRGLSSICFSTASTVSFGEEIWGPPYWDNQTSEIVLPTFPHKREILAEEFSNFKYKRDLRFDTIQYSLKALIEFIKDLRKLEPLLKNDSLFTDS